MPFDRIVLLVLRPMWIIFVPVSACWWLVVTATEENSPTDSSPWRMTLGYFQVMAEPVSTWVQVILARLPMHLPRLVTKLKMPPLPVSGSPGYQFWTVLYLMVASSPTAISSTTAAWSWFS